jgi:Zn-dependent peptidase ImmA (M78 family)
MLEIPILGRKIAVRYVSDKELQTLGNDTDLLGFFYRNTIYISTSITGDQAKQVLLHELNHAILEITGLSSVLEDKQEEAVCTALESYLEIIRNKKLTEFLR